MKLNEPLYEGQLRIQRLLPGLYELLRGQRNWPRDKDLWWETKEAEKLLIEVFNELGKKAPRGYYFGAHNQDLSRYGYWRENVDHSEEQ